MEIVGIHLGNFHKSGKQRSYRIRNLEERTEDGKLTGHRGTERIWREKILWREGTYIEQLADAFECSCKEKKTKG
jgi:hypothetical protein